jgi:phytoene synthase
MIVLGACVMNTNEDLSPEHSLAQNGKSFHWAGKFLGPKVGRDARRLYSFCRVLDDMADGDIANGPKRLGQIRIGLIDATVTGDLLLPELSRFISEKEIASEIVVALIDGLLQDQKTVALADESALLRYSYRVAGTVGLMMSAILGCTDRAALVHAVDLGIAMQLTNIARDVHEDASMGRRYLPASWVGDMTPTQILTAAHGEPSSDRVAISAAVDRLLQLAETYYKSGIEGLVYLPVRAHLAIAVAAQVYRQIGVQIVTKGFQWNNGREVTNKRAKFACSVRALYSLHWRLGSYPSHKAVLHDTLVGLPYAG